MPTKDEPHPSALEIDPMSCGAGVLGLTLCPGKQGLELLRGLHGNGTWGSTCARSWIGERRPWFPSWRRTSFRMLKVPNLGDAAEAAGTRVAPFADPGRQDPQGGLRAALDLLRSRFAKEAQIRERTIVVHCRGGLGRTGMIAARLAIESGEAPEAALRRVREVSRVERWRRRAQEDYVLGQRASGCGRALRRPGPRLPARRRGRRRTGLRGGVPEPASAFESAFGPEGIREPALNTAGQAVVSDDTQMTLFTAEGLTRSVARERFHRAGEGA